MFRNKKKAAKKSTQKLVASLTDTVLGKPKKKHTKKKAALAIGVVGTAAAVIANEALKGGDEQ